MGMELDLEAEVVVTFPTGYTKRISDRCSLWSTPTKVTREALKSEDPLGVYMDWVKEVDSYDSTYVCADHAERIADIENRADRLACCMGGLGGSSVPLITVTAEEFEALSKHLAHKRIEEHYGEVIAWVEEKTREGWTIIWGEI